MAVPMNISRSDGSLYTNSRVISKSGSVTVKVSTTCLEVIEKPAPETVQTKSSPSGSVAEYVPAYVFFPQGLR